MDIIKETPVLKEDLKKLVDSADKIFQKTFGKDVWFGRCIFLSWYCEKGTCDFCFRSTQKHKISHPEMAQRSIPSIMSEALLIKAFNWRLEFLTGGYGSYPWEKLMYVMKNVYKILGTKLWVNLGTLDDLELEKIKPYTEGIVSSLETLEPNLHNKVCPDKPIEPYLEMIERSRKFNFKQSFTIIIGLNEKKEDYKYVSDLIKKYHFDRITVYALRPVAGTPYTHGPTPEEVVWWIARIRNDFPHIEIIAGTAIYRLPEISLMLKAGANAITKLPATKIYNTKNSNKIYEEIKKANRNFISSFYNKNVRNIIDWNKIIDETELTNEDKIKTKETIERYLKNLEKNLNK